MFTPKYLAPKTLEEACSMLHDYRKEATIIAGGTDLLVQMKCREALPSVIINIGGIADQDFINFEEGAGLRIGAQATVHSIASSSLIWERFGVLAQAASELGTPRIRRRATIAGNLCHASPSADLAPALIVLGANLKIVAVDRERNVTVEDFFSGPGQTVLNPDEIVTEIQVPPLAAQSGGVYFKQTVRKTLDLAIVGVAVVTTMDGDIFRDIKIALGAVGATPLRAKAAEGTLRDKKISNELLQQAGKAASDESSPIDDVRSSAEYRRRMVEVLTIRAIKQAVGQVK
jgi:carbon-monoxide dehydrogenase medium subunit